jgi:hypothetical protein
MRLCQLFLASRIFLATTTKTNTSGNTLLHTDIMSNKHFLGVFSATYIFNHDNSRFLGMYLFIFISHIRFILYSSSHRVCLIELLLYDNVCAMNITYIVHNVQDYILNFFLYNIAVLPVC